MPEPHLRASDSDRAAVATALGEHMAAGRLTLAEYEERVTQVYDTKTLGGLAALTADLPDTGAARSGSAATRSTSGGSSLAGVKSAARATHGLPAHGGACGAGPWSMAGHSSARAAWRAWLTTAFIVLSVWLVTSIASATVLYFWPVWVIGPWGAVLLARTLADGRSGRGRADRGHLTY